MYFICPKCGSTLKEDGGACKCPAGHSFDKSREGYYNLLLGSSGGVHGDNKEMVEARRRFLCLGHYRPLAELVAEMAVKSIHAGGVMLDAGLGEGYYTEIVAQRLAAEYGVGAVSVIGFDISKDAVKRAAKRQGMTSLAVASSYHMPIKEASVDLVLNIFSPQAAEETQRVLKSSGKFLMVIPGEEHLFGLKEKVYDTPYKNAPENTDIEGFRLLEKRELRYTVSLDSAEDISALFLMTPYAYRTSKEGRERVLSLNTLSTEAHFLALLYEKK